MVKVFTSSTCAVCPTVKRFLDYKKIQYQEVSIETDEGRTEYNKIADGRTTVPMVYDGSRPIFGYNAPALSQLA